MVPHERSLVKRLENKPFVLLGINSDPESSYRSAVKDGGITWQNWFDGGSPFGPIAMKWNVHLWPTIYVLDTSGVIRYVGHGTGMEEAVDKLLKESDVVTHPSQSP